MHAHATIALWAREEDGSYHAERDGWKLRVSWTPETATGGERAHGFRWLAEGPDDAKVEAPEALEEIEIAMMQAEHVATHGGALPDPIP